MKAILWTHYKAKDGLFPLRIRTTKTENGRTKVTYSDTGIRLREDQFKNGLVTKHPKAQEYNFRLLSLLNAPEKVTRSFMEHFSDYKDRPVGYYHKRKLESIYRILATRNPSPTLEFVMRLGRELTNEGKHPNYVAGILKIVRSVIGVMVACGDLDYHKNPFNHYELKWVKTEKARLTLEELTTLQKCKLFHLKGPELARDMYMVSYYQGGVRFGDLCRLSKDNIQGERFHYTMSKTGLQMNLPLHPTTLSILKKYKYQFPLKINWRHEEKSINAKNALMNKHLKNACKLAGVPEVTFHTSRHSIADHAVKKKLSSKQLQGILGHGKLSTTEAYLKGFYREETDSGMDQLFG